MSSTKVQTHKYPVNTNRVSVRSKSTHILDRPSPDSSRLKTMDIDPSCPTVLLCVDLDSEQVGEKNKLPNYLKRTLSSSLGQ